MNDCHAFKDDPLLNDADFMLEAMERDVNALSCVGDGTALAKNESFWLTAVKRNAEAMKHARLHGHDRFLFVIEAGQGGNIDVLKYVDRNNPRKDRLWWDMVQDAIPEAWKYMPESLRDEFMPESLRDKFKGFKDEINHDNDILRPFNLEFLDSLKDELKPKPDKFKGLKDHREDVMMDFSKRFPGIKDEIDEYSMAQDELKPNRDKIKSLEDEMYDEMEILKRFKGIKDEIDVYSMAKAP
eukprot:CAMPEP_0198508462 /NCGR_PEP_ID=MMETSP1462-20131121/12976_1 /TAXON_ID=1333877 /ORGANISM="Brandtodinium nutriculum, Strain RCC3387" /LENGTH=240 /DNA_ID=CAMNT_0044237743 /DNA_START=21 /DNA_END=743 /DNA_ORIENTATION=+